MLCIGFSGAEGGIDYTDGQISYPPPSAGRQHRGMLSATGDNYRFMIIACAKSTDHSSRPWLAFTYAGDVAGRVGRAFHYQEISGRATGK